MPEPIRFPVLLKRWGIALLAVSLIAIGAYVLCEVGEAQPRAANKELTRSHVPYP